MGTVSTELPSATSSSVYHRIASELGVYSIWSASWDTKLLCLQRFTRLFAYGASTLVLALYLSSLGNSDTRIGLFMTLTLLGDVVISFLLTLVADGLGRRRILVIGAALMAASGVVFAFSGNYWILVLASILGVISPRYYLSVSLQNGKNFLIRANSGNEIGPFRAIEESTLAQLTPPAIRSDIFAWYTLIGTAGTASGTIACGWLVQYMIGPGRMRDIAAYRMIFGVYAALGLVKLVLSFMLSNDCESGPPKPTAPEVVETDAAEETERLLSDSEDENDDDQPQRDGEVIGKIQKQSKQSYGSIKSKPQGATHVPFPEVKRKPIIPSLSPASRSILIKLCALFALDSLASGLVPSSWIIYFFNQRFSIAEGALGTLFFVTNIISSISNLAASSLAKRIGLVKTMVFTHLPSAIFLALIPLPSVSWLAMAFLILRSCMQSMDQAPRQAFLSAAVLPAERTAVMGVVNVVKTLSQSGGPVVTGWLAGTHRFWVAFLVAGAMKATYDLALLTMFLGYKSREATAEAEGEAQGEGEGEGEGGGDGEGEGEGLPRRDSSGDASSQHP